MRIELGVVAVDSTADVLSAQHPAPFKVLRHNFMSAWHYVLYMKAMRLQMYGTAEDIVIVRGPDELEQLAARMTHLEQDRWIQQVRDDIDTANWVKFHSNPDMLELLLSTGSQLIVSTVYPGTFWSAPVLAQGKRLSDKLQWVGNNLEGISLMRTRDRIVVSRTPTVPGSLYAEHVSLHTMIDECWAWEPDFARLVRERYDAWISAIRARPLPELIAALHAYMRQMYWDVDVHDPNRAAFLRWVEGELFLDLPPDPALLSNEQHSDQTP